MMAKLKTKRLFLIEDKTEDTNSEDWHIKWQIFLKGDNEPIGSACLLSKPDKKGQVFISYGLNEEYRGKGYMTEAINALCQHIFYRPDIYFICAHSNKDNEPSNKLLEKCGFTMVSETEDSLLWEMEKPATSWMSIWMCLGLGIGGTMGNILFENFSTGMCYGMVLGMVFGLILDNADRNKRKKLKEVSE